MFEFLQVCKFNTSEALPQICILREALWTAFILFQTFLCESIRKCSQMNRGGESQTKLEISFLSMWGETWQSEWKPPLKSTDHTEGSQNGRAPGPMSAWPLGPKSLKTMHLSKRRFLYGLKMLTTSPTEGRKGHWSCVHMLLGESKAALTQSA